jgi:uncharacterized surface protein with fasciclin (FAS1) repeats
MKIMKQMKVVLALGVMALLLVAATGCGDDNETTASDAAEATAPMGSEDIVAVASGDEQFSTLVSAIEAAGLVETLQGEGPFTVFAPNNEAFEALPAGTLDDLLKPENKDQLTDILTYHVVPGKVMSADLQDGQEVETVQGEKLTIKLGDSVEVEGVGSSATVIAPDIEASNGVIHVIDAVLLPAK